MNDQFSEHFNLRANSWLHRRQTPINVPNKSRLFNNIFHSQDLRTNHENDRKSETINGFANLSPDAAKLSDVDEVHEFIARQLRKIETDRTSNETSVRITKYRVVNPKNSLTCFKQLYLAKDRKATNCRLYVVSDNAAKDGRLAAKLNQEFEYQTKHNKLLNGSILKQNTPQM